MPHLARLSLPDGIFHVTARGVWNRLIFTCDADRLAFLAFLRRSTRRFRSTCHAYCLMGTHYHLLVETSADALARGMQQLNGNYARDFNRRHERRGHVFASRYASWLVEREAHFEAACEYIANNPVRAELCERPEDWRWLYVATAYPEPRR